MELKFQTYDVFPQLKGYIQKIWVFESSQPMPREDMKLVVPNGRLLMVIPFRNGLIGKMGDQFHQAKTHKIALVGMSDRSSIVDAETDGPTGTLGVEISPIGAYRFFHIRLKEIKNQLYYLTDILNSTVKEIEQRIAEAISIEDKVSVLQHYLLSLFTNGKVDPLFEQCLRHVEASQGNLRIKALEHQTGYTSRWLNMKFEERLGVSPKNLNSIIRFQQYYQPLLTHGVDFFRQKKFYDHYHDESHFIKDFKRFTGLPPATLIRMQNEFGKAFYKD